MAAYKLPLYFKNYYLACISIKIIRRLFPDDNKVESSDHTVAPSRPPGERMPSNRQGSALEMVLALFKHLRIERLDIDVRSSCRVSRGN